VRQTNPTEQVAAKPAPGLSELGIVFFRIGNFTFGGGAATTAALQRELVQRRGWLDDVAFALCYSLSRITPGTNLLAFCTATGWLLRSWRGALVTVLVASIPACAIVWVVTAGFDRISSIRWVQVGIEGALASSVGILLASFWLLVRPYLDRRNWQRSVVIVGASIFLSLYLHMAPIPVLALAAVAGIFWEEAENP
jgi:chromate transporter